MLQAESPLGSEEILPSLGSSGGAGSAGGGNVLGAGPGGPGGPGAPSGPNGLGNGSQPGTGPSMLMSGPHHQSAASAACNGSNLYLGAPVLPAASAILYSQVSGPRSEPLLRITA